MILIQDLKGDEKKELLQVLYEEEIFYTVLIEHIESNYLKRCYIQRERGVINSILNINNEGNSLFTTFWVRKRDELQIIANQLRSLKYGTLLLAGKKDEIREVLSYLRIEREIHADLCFVYNDNSPLVPQSNGIRKAQINEEDMYYIRKFYIDFFQLDNEELQNEIVKKEKIEGDIKKGLYFIIENNVPIGMGRYGSMTRNHIELTTIYIQSEFRGQGYGRQLLIGLVQSCLEKGKTPILQTSSENLKARSLYERIGFVFCGEYSFEFI
ncbi:GNAT family N-acetyltransferase [Bacillus gaemokensis]|uniref:N-acetyltransferase domain-containing protein n=1 Tax=Bacillus gaemokensis TaxID=574375 RepID=A0A073K9V2_9BACI|nr:GNAT family N-acetyltransferase [Bacillus gaemokensis]KEK23237.1 hypothetical protein BAGA_09900 [Bacillus gaemokensis]KYG29014.1 hypothetical protein AZF08_15005 [Bacillus gaemokensis]